MDHVEHDYPMPPITEYSKRIPWRLRHEGRILRQLPEDFVDKSLDTLVELILAHFEFPMEEENLDHVAFILQEKYFVNFDTRVLEFLEHHTVDLIHPLLRESIVISWRRNSSRVEMLDLQPFLAVFCRVWTKGTFLCYFIADRDPIMRFSTQKCIRSNFLKFSRMRHNNRDESFYRLT